jgi:flagellar biosynthetic protein FliR
MLMLMPALGDAGVPVRVRLILALLLTLMVQPLIGPSYPAGLLANTPRLLAVLLAEVAVGVFLGLTVQLVMAASQVAGTAIANQLGLAFAMSVDPAQGQQGAILSNFLALLAATLIFTMDLHHVALRGVVDSFTLFRPGQVMPIGDFAEMGLKLIAEAFVVGVKIAAPFLVFGTIFYFAFGLVGKLMPQFQVFFIAMPLGILVGFLILVAILGTLMGWYMDHVALGFGRLRAP